MDFLVKTKPEDYFENLFKILHLVKPLRPKEIKVLSSILLVHYLNKDKYDEKELSEKLFSKGLRVKIADALKMTEGAVNVTITALRKKGLIKGKVISPDLVKLYPSKKPLEINYRLVLK
jgi:DNA-binding MarR family transcriptional regulator